MNKIITFILTLLSFQFYNAILVVYSSIKPTLITEHHFTQSFLGTIDLLHFLGRFIGTFYLIIYPPRRLNLANFLSTIAQLAGLLLLTSIQYTNTGKQYLAAAGMAFFGITRGIITIPFILLLTQFHKERDSKAISAWMAAGPSGNAIGFLYAQLVLAYTNIQWNYLIIIFAVLYLIVNGLMLILVKQTDIKTFENLTFQERVSAVKTSFLNFTNRHSNKLLAMEAIIIEDVNFTTNLWSPVYFSNIGLGQYGKVVPMTLPIVLSFGSIILSFLSQNDQTLRKIWVNAFIGIQTLSFLWLWPLKGDSGELPFYFSIYILLGLTQGGLMGYISGNQVINCIEGDTSDEYNILNIIKSLRALHSALMLQLFGFCIQISNENFVYLSVLNGVFLLSINLLRDYLRKKEDEELLRIKKEESLLEE